MKAIYYIITIVTAVFVLASCSDELESRGPVEFCVRAVWENGRPEDGTRTLSATDLLTPATADIPIAYADYPLTVTVTPSNGAAFVLSRGSSVCASHNGYYHYSSDYELDQDKINNSNLTFTATATIDDEADVLTGRAEKVNLVDEHLQFTLHHTKALVRFGFQVDTRYDKIRQIQLQEVAFNDVPLAFTPVVITTASQLICYTYVLPSNVKDGITTGTPNKLSCKYSIYDKDAKFDGTMKDTELAEHITRKDVVAQNTFTFGGLKNGSTPVTSLQAGYYYDLHITLNPDYLYVLSDHDNKEHLTVN